MSTTRSGRTAAVVPSWWQPIRRSIGGAQSVNFGDLFGDGGLGDVFGGMFGQGGGGQRRRVKGADLRRPSPSDSATPSRALHFAADPQRRGVSDVRRFRRTPRERRLTLAQSAVARAKR